MDQRITLQTRSAGANSLGEASGAWADSFGCWAKAEPLRGREFFAAAQLQSTIDVRFRVRYRTDITASMRVVWRGEPYDIVGEPINVDAANDELQLMCTKGIRDGR